MEKGLVVVSLDKRKSVKSCLGDAGAKAPWLGLGWEPLRRREVGGFFEGHERQISDMTVT